MKMNDVEIPTIESVMNHRVEAFSPDLPIAEAIGILLGRGYSGAPVVDAQAKDGHEGRFGLVGDGEALATGLVAAHVAKRLMDAPSPPGVLHVEQLLDLEALLEAAGNRLIQVPAVSPSPM